MPRSIKLVAVVSLVAFGVALWAASGAQGAHTDNQLNVIASAVAGHPVTVQCADNAHEWVATEDHAGLKFEVDAFTFVGGAPTVWASLDECDTLLAIIRKGPAAVGPLDAALAIKTIIHESVHQRGVFDERTTDCTALSLVRKYATQFFGYPATVVQTTYVHVAKTTRYKRVVKTVPNPQLVQLVQWATYWHNFVPSFGGPC